jgi:hypothetical protein
MKKMIEPEELDQHVGWYVKLWRKETGMMGKIEAVDKAEKKITYELVSGPEKGSRLRSRYETAQAVEVCTDESLVLALLDLEG